MFDLIQINEHDYYINCPSKIGVVIINDNEVILIDSGNDKEAGKKIFRILEDKGWKLKAIYNTHCHADHIGGNKYLQDKTGCKIYSKGIETEYINNPILEPIGLYGALPLKDLQNKFFMAQPSIANEISEILLPNGIEVLSLPGHSQDMVGYLTKDKTAYIGDCISSIETLEKYKIGYMYDPQQAKRTLEYVKMIEAKHYVPSHADMTENIKELADKNIISIDETFDVILSFCSNAITFEQLLKKVFEKYRISSTIQQYVLIGSIIRSYLTNLFEQRKITFEFVNNEMLWKRV